MSKNVDRRFCLHGSAAIYLAEILYANTSIDKCREVMRRSDIFGNS